MKKSDTIVEEIHAIRRQIDEETRDMTPDEHTAYFRKSTDEVAKQFNFKRVDRAPRNGGHVFQ
ncbi:hypothetical protein FACS18948_3850 [Clostridia bacterium]|nr:hypothetical protein FACS18948_3850 [Clostridia bacterium]